VTVLDADLTVLERACRRAGIEYGQPELIRAGENTLLRLPDSVVARIARPGRAAVAEKEVNVSRWLAAAGVPVVAVLPGIEQPVIVDDRAVTFWRELPPHRMGSSADVGGMLSLIHRLPPPTDFGLPRLDPLVRLAERLQSATAIDESDRAWLLDRVSTLREQYDGLPAGLPWCAVHGDAWAGNIVVTDAGAVVLDLERFAYGPPEWDLATVAVDCFSLATVSREEWLPFCASYGHDVTTWPGYDVLRDIRELRKLTFAVQLSDQYPHARAEATHRITCVRNEYRRPWRWRGLP
jgi:aminoglycoside phosphotransferase (APT) family kinase protein